jgi:hypothetical protein
MTATANIGRVGYRRATRDEWQAEVHNDERFPADTTFVLLERTERIEFVTKKDATDKRLFDQHWTSGRLFNAEWELQWEKQGDTFQLRLLTEGDLPDGWQTTKFETGEETSVLLFGERKRDTDRGWREARIPRWLEYPVAKTLGRVRLVAIPYAKQGMVVRMRLKGVKSA